MGLLDMIFGKKRERCVVHQKVKCPNCKREFELTEDVDRCPWCGVHVELLFVKRCPNCGERNNIFAVKCERCGYDFCAEKYRMEKEKRLKYRCPFCGFRADYMFDRCPQCGARIYW